MDNDFEDKEWNVNLQRVIPFLQVTVSNDHVPMTTFVDKGGEVNAISETLLEKIGQPPLLDTRLELETYVGDTNALCRRYQRSKRILCHLNFC